MSMNSGRRDPRTGFRTRRTGLLIAGVLLLLVVSACNPERTEAVRHYNQGMQAFNSESASAAVQHMDRALEQDPTFHVAAYTVGQIRQQTLGDPGAAEDDYRQALDHDPDNPRYAYRLGSALADQGEHEEAIEYFDQAIELDSNYARAWYEKGMSQDAAGRPRKAVDSLMEAITIQPRLRLDEEDVGGQHYHALADLYLRYRLYDHAVRTYENGVRNNPDSARLHHGLGIARMELGRYDEAVESFQKALEIDEHHSSANFNLAVALHESGRTEEAIAQLEEITEGGSGMNQARMQAAESLLTDLEEEVGR